MIRGCPECHNPIEMEPGPVGFPICRCSGCGWHGRVSSCVDIGDDEFISNEMRAVFEKGEKC